MPKKTKKKPLPVDTSLLSNEGVILPTRTRPTNASKRPGLPDLPRFDPDKPDRVPTPPREHRDNIRAAQLQEAEDKDQMEKKKKKAIDQAARLQLQNREADERAAERRRNPSPAPPPVSRSRMEQDAVHPGSEQTDSETLTSGVYAHARMHPHVCQ